MDAEQRAVTDTPFKWGWGKLTFDKHLGQTPRCCLGRSDTWGVTADKSSPCLCVCLWNLTEEKVKPFNLMMYFHYSNKQWSQGTGCDPWHHRQQRTIRFTPSSLSPKCSPSTRTCTSLSSGGFCFFFPEMVIIWPLYMKATPNSFKRCFRKVTKAFEFFFFKRISWLLEL